MGNESKLKHMKFNLSIDRLCNFIYAEIATNWICTCAQNISNFPNSPRMMMNRLFRLGMPNWFLHHLRFCKQKKVENIHFKVAKPWDRVCVSRDEMLFNIRQQTFIVALRFCTHKSVCKFWRRCLKCSRASALFWGREEGLRHSGMMSQTVLFTQPSQKIVWNNDWLRLYCLCGCSKYSFTAWNLIRWCDQ